MTRRLGCALVGSVVLAAAGTAAASIMTLDPSAFASGQYVSYATAGVTLSTMTLVPVGTVGGRTEYGPDLGPVYSFDDTFSPSPGGSGGAPGDWYTLNGLGSVAPSTCLQGCAGPSSLTVQWLRVDFSSPVMQVDVLQQQNLENNAEVAAFDSAGDLVGECAGYAEGAVQGYYPCMSVAPSQFSGSGTLLERPWADYSIVDGSADIRTLLIGCTLDDASNVGTIQYGTVPEPGSLGLIALGLLGLAWAHRRSLVASRRSPSL
jgi:hypothetical protein